MIYTRVRTPSTPWPWHAFASAVCLVFVIVQASSIDYGTTINNLPHIAGHKVDPATASTATLDRRNLISAPSGIAETLDKWMLRFKLYSVEPDEVVSVMALARIKPAELKFDPGFYTYGGAFLYPLGGFYTALSHIGMVRPGPLVELLSEPDRMDAVYIYGRVFVLLAFAVSAFVLWRTLVLVTSPGIALMGLGIYLLCPATIMYSQLMKPHWYGLLWANLALYGVVRLFVERQWSLRAALVVGLGIGLAVGSANTFALFSVLIGFAIVLAALRGFARWRDLLIVPAVALATFFATNPYLLISYSEAAGERAWAWDNWFRFGMSPTSLGLFVYNSLLPAIGIALTGVLFAVAMLRVVKPSQAGERYVAIGVLLVVVITSAVTSAQANWHTNIRFAPYLLSVGLVFLAATALPRKGAVFGVVLALTAIQAMPMILAYRDVDDPETSTRLQAARWVEANIPAGSAVRLGTATPSPYEVPPFDLARYRINAPDADFVVLVHGELPGAAPIGVTLLRRFRPRLTIDQFALTIGYANPVVSIYRKAE